MTPTYIKMDIEGAEPEALAGGSELLRRINLCSRSARNHRSEHLWQIPDLIRSIAPEYHVFLRRYAEECWRVFAMPFPNAVCRRA